MKIIVLQRHQSQVARAIQPQPLTRHKYIVKAAILATRKHQRPVTFLEHLWYMLPNYWYAFVIRLALEIAPLNRLIADPLHVVINFVKTPLLAGFIHLPIKWVIQRKRLFGELCDLGFYRLILLVCLSPRSIHSAHKSIALSWNNLIKFFHITIDVLQDRPHAFADMRSNVAVITHAV